jgi:PTS system fructose-specific IIB component
MKLVAVTACPTGIAHSQMAAENLEQTAEKEGHEITVEIQGAMGAENELSSEGISAADAAIIAADTSVNRDRFADVPVVKGTVKDGINDPESLFERAREAAGEGGESTDGREGGADTTEVADDADSGGDADATSTRERSGNGIDADAASSAPENDETKRDLEASAPSGDVDPDQVGGDPRKGLFARLRRLLS